MKKEATFFLQHISESSNAILNFVKGLSKDRFLKDRKTQSAVIRELEIIGEATKNLEIRFITEHPEIPWSGMAKTRDLLIHQYFGVDLDKIWDLTKKEIPELNKGIKKIICK